MDGLQITIHNFSGQAWTRNPWVVGAGKTSEVNWVDEVSKSPLELIGAHEGATTAAANSEHLSWLAKDALWMRLGYDSQDGHFAVELRQSFHLFGIGPQCEWLWEDGKWSDSTTSSDSHIWHFKTCTVTATPTLSSSGATVDIAIYDIGKKP